MPRPMILCLAALLACCLPATVPAAERPLHAEESTLLAADLLAVEGVPGSDLALLVLAAAGRQVGMFTGRNEAAAILRARDGVTPDRPQTHELLVSSFALAGWTVKRVVVDRLDAEGNFHAAIEFEDRGSRIRRLDSRPSDAIAVALRAGARLYLAREVVEQAGQEARPAAPQIST